VIFDAIVKRRDAYDGSIIFSNVLTYDLCILVIFKGNEGKTERFGSLRFKARAREL
jgi:hypothetical protein